MCDFNVIERKINSLRRATQLDLELRRVGLN